MRTLEDIHSGINESLIKNVGIGKAAYFETLIKKYGIEFQASDYHFYKNNKEAYTEENGKIIVKATMVIYNNVQGHINKEIEIPEFVEFDKGYYLYIQNCPQLLKLGHISEILIRECFYNDAYIDADVDKVTFDGYEHSSALPGIKKAKVVEVKSFLGKATSCGEINCDKFVFGLNNFWEDSFVDEFKNNVRYKKIIIKDKSFVISDITKIDANSSYEDILIHLDIPDAMPNTDALGNTLNVGDFVYFGRKGDWANTERIGIGVILKISGEKVSIKTTQRDKSTKFNRIVNAFTACCNCIKIDKNKFIKEAKFKF